jgi:hypothetical protein
MNELTTQQALDLLHHCLTSGEVSPSRHFLSELSKETLNIPDAWHVLRYGNIFQPCDRDIKTGEWKYTVEGHTPDGDWLCVVFCFKSIDYAKLITTFTNPSMRREL